MPLLPPPLPIRHIAFMPMPSVPDFTATSLDDLAAFIAGDALPPVERWNPAHCGAIDIRIAADGRWFHEGGRLADRRWCGLSPAFCGVKTMVPMCW